MVCVGARTGINVTPESVLPRPGSVAYPIPSDVFVDDETCSASMEIVSSDSTNPVYDDGITRLEIGT